MDIMELIIGLARRKRTKAQADAVARNLCAKCRRPVPYGNSVRMFDTIYNNCPEILMLQGDWHLLPVTENGVQICEGSPSRCQYFEGFPRDPRGKTTYKPEKEARKRAAFAKMRPEA